ncbi:hypothetical protein BJV78DRAFT_1242673 [Lactifluus subvellereus]|nr:hypothetical protein BJV78DRAFT_1242673 [Lactifluus subvellereus]
MTLLAPARFVITNSVRVPGTSSLQCSQAPQIIEVMELSPGAVGCGRRQMGLLCFGYRVPGIYLQARVRHHSHRLLFFLSLHNSSPGPCSRRRRLSCPHQSPWTTFSEPYSLGRSLHLCDCWGLVIFASPNLTKCLVSMAQPGYKSIPIILITAQRIGCL